MLVIDSDGMCRPSYLDEETLMPRLHCALIPLATALLMAGCQSNEAFNASISRATIDISKGRLEQARTTLFEADSLASGPDEQQKVEDLTAVVNGAEAMINGDSVAASVAWSNVEDDNLRWQLQREAKAMGLQLESNN